MAEPRRVTVDGVTWERDPRYVYRWTTQGATVMMPSLYWFKRWELLDKRFDWTWTNHFTRRGAMRAYARRREAR